MVRVTESSIREDLRKHRISYACAQGKELYGVAREIYKRFRSHFRDDDSNCYQLALTEAKEKGLIVPFRGSPRPTGFTPLADPASSMSLEECFALQDEVACA